MVLDTQHLVCDTTDGFMGLASHDPMPLLNGRANSSGSPGF